MKVDSNAELNYVKETGRDDYDDYDVADEVFGAVVENIYYCSKNKDKREENLLKRIRLESGVDKKFLIFNTNDFHADTRALYKIRRLTGMGLAQMSTHSAILSYGFTDQITSVARTDN